MVRLTTAAARFTRQLLLVSLVAGAAACQAATPTTPLAGGSTMVSGTVYVDAATSEQPLAGATVVVTSAGESRSATTSARGYYTLPVPAGTATITASKDGYATKSWAVDVNSDLTVNFSLASE